MRKKISTLALLILLTVYMPASYANWFGHLIDLIKKSNQINKDMFNREGKILQVEEDIDSLTRQMNSHMIGNSGWGTYQFHDYQSYGSGAHDWAQVMNMAESGRGGGELGNMISGLSRDFPSDRQAYNRGVSGIGNQRYYAMKTQTILAARAASQLDYNKIQDQINYQQMLQMQIEKTKNLKAAIDLSNRIQVEGNLINLEILRQTALANQQQAVSDQGAVNSALFNAKFLTK